MTLFCRCLLSVVFAGVACAAMPFANADGLSDITDRGVLRVAVPQDFPPFGSVGPDMKPRGLDIDMAQLIADKLGVKLALTPVGSPNRIPFLTTGKVDLVISSLGKTPEREEVIGFSSKYAPFYMGIYGPKEVEVSKPADLDGKSVGLTRGALEDIETSRVAPPGTKIKRFEDNNTTIAAFLANQVELIASGNSTMAVIAEKNPHRPPLLKFKLKDSGCYVGIAKDETALKEKINAIIASAKADGTLNKLSEQWLKETLPADF
ncbi:MAG: amino acid transporter substrate-binding protein [Pseudomonas sp.]|jgi:polar amino acid transport system substrate-binding protein|uniref:transporter substrate-binding domain-containing protein n=1 Tax=Pseudomonas sp. TaxID=306 RepID=UPI00261F1D61|nr:transporter substrate-binding domain-containing protein [Pseudomonas sp.]MDB6047694.1 amino acid transporter substrate-binding protein [Pseudomonas sp.]